MLLFTIFYINFDFSSFLGELEPESFLERSLRA